MKKILNWILILVGFCIFLAFLLYSFVYLKTGHFRFTEVSKIPSSKVAIIFGARIYSNGDLSPFLKDRVDGGIELLRQGKVEKLLMSGDNHIKEYNEVVAMQKYALSQGISQDKIVLDYAGFSTYESCYRAKEIFGVKAAILVSQNYHIPRAVFTCRKLGIDAIGYGQPDWKRYRDVMPRTQFREYLAQIKMFVDLYITRPLPTFLGSKEYIK